jgi:hypothetical protein
MRTVTRLKTGPVAVLVLLALLTLLAVHRRGVTAEEAQGEAVGAAVKLGGMAVRDEYAVVASLALLALFAFVTWIALRADDGQDGAKPPAGGSSAGDRAASR